MKDIHKKWMEKLYFRFMTIYGDKFVRPYHTDEFILAWQAEWLEGLSGISGPHMKEALLYCKMNLDWPPSVAEFRKICEKAAGLPSVGEAIALALRGDMSSPLVSIAYQAVGSWAMHNDKEAVLFKKFTQAYQDALHQYRSNLIQIKGNTNEPRAMDSKQELLMFPDKKSQ